MFIFSFFVFCDQGCGCFFFVLFFILPQFLSAPVWVDNEGWGHRSLTERAGKTTRPLSGALGPWAFHRATDERCSVVKYIRRGHDLMIVLFNSNRLSPHKLIAAQFAIQTHSNCFFFKYHWFFLQPQPPNPPAQFVFVFVLFHYFVHLISICQKKRNIGMSDN